ncbi:MULTISPECIES: peptide chain release factor N(5)-glutamine methyltransferase [unclassified Halanaerobium]|uniref:peptide chain release factor N(5)-glutamine methyltransferase n=1 Tax=unclassified Halanaerobium TaxID=2641197 RepID=UPI000DF3FFAA|nr:MULTISPECIES: peptide chain release factor N(5)-glutamine methyltransferase [unclassified Halanaerobium]RCW48271.1 release factor glutamine methyltransferase [Halanaerobium sp. MA284_MarDTE_T2]RCW85698.1 release factor glutamine methyltransferase [Halanaerobium sp. DL-01]
MNIKELLSKTDNFFNKVGLDSPRLDAEVLLADLLDMERIKLYVNFDYPLSSQELKEYRERVKQRAKRIPVAYITGKKEFMSMKFYVEPGVLIPRPETELLVEKVIDFCKENKLKSANIVDIGTGSGAVAISLAKYVKDACTVGVDISQKSVEVARKNLAEHSLEERVSIVRGSLLEQFIKRDINNVDIIVSNPPYIKDEDMASLPPEVKKEPTSALAGGKEGLDYYKKIIPQAEKVLKKDGHIFFEIGDGQAEDVLSFFGERWEEEKMYKDYSGRERIISARFVG